MKIITKKRVLIAVLSVLAVALLVFLAIFLSYFTKFKSIDPELPRLDIYTENRAKIKSKTTYIKCTVSLSETESEYEFTDLAAEVRGRGNSTWLLFPKKPYRIKFEEKQSFFGEAENRSWVLLAMYNDLSYVKDRLGLALAESIAAEDEFVPSTRYVELYINGKYKGLYLLTDQIDENSGRVDVKEDFAPTDVEIPFLVEIDSFAPDEGVEGVDYFSIGDFHFNIKYPESDERYTEAQFDYVEDYIKTVDGLCRKKNVTVAELSEYIDLESFIDYYIVQELMGQTDMDDDAKSVYMSKSSSGKLKMGPVWDFDWAVNGPYFGQYKNKYLDKTEGLRSKINWFSSLYNNSPEFRAALAERYLEIRDVLEATIDAVASEKDAIVNAVERDRIFWHRTHEDHDFEKRFDEVIDWVSRRLLWMDKAFGGR